jgi:parallel beta-helix repeat protein
MFRKLLTALCLALVVTLTYVHSARSFTYTVTTTDDIVGEGSLRWAINQANDNPGPDTITFDIDTGLCEDGVCTISLGSILPPLTDDGTTIDGYTQPGAEQATATSPATIVIHIVGGLMDPNTLNNGLNIVSSDNLIRGLSITNFPGNGIAIGSYEDWLGSSNVIVGNYIGVSPDGLTENGNGVAGVFIGLGATNNRIGGSTPAERNVISGNLMDGVAIHGSGTANNRVRGNYIGTDDSGTVAVPNAAHGVRIYGGAQDNTIGGDDPAERNIISGNGVNGIFILGTEAETSGNTVMGNYIGTDVSGTSDLGNRESGVQIVDGVENAIEYGNVISGNDYHGVCIQGAKAIDNVIASNFIGTNASGSAALGNFGMGIYLYAGSTATSILDNVISANGSLGIWVDGSDGNVIWSNYIGVDVSGVIPLGNISFGIGIGGGSKDNQVGSDSPANRNVISANEGDGIHLSGAGTTGNTIAGNYVGLAANGSTRLPNEDGIRLEGVQDNTIGPSNVISGNSRYGIWLTGPDTNGNLIWANYIGTNASGTSARGNLYSGVSIWGGASNNTIGGTVYPDSGNLISGNLENGVEITGEGTIDNTVSGNFIGTDAEGLFTIPNESAGVIIRLGAQSNMVGGISTAERNIISGNEVGVIIRDENTSDNFISGNYIGTGISRLIELGNERSGVSITSYAPNNAIGPGNTIAHNYADGVHIDTPLAVGNMVLENSIFDNFELGIDLSNGGNNMIPSPVIESSTMMPFSVSGSACAECLVEVYCSQDDDGEGEVPLGHILADASGNFTLALERIYYPYLTATASTLVDGTSEFSSVYLAELPNYLFMPAVMR